MMSRRRGRLTVKRVETACLGNAVAMMHYLRIVNSRGSQRADGEEQGYPTHRHSPVSALIGYMRVSKADGSQVLDLQRDALLAGGVSERHLYCDTASGKKDDRAGLAACLQALRGGDTLVVWKLDRLGRNLRHLVNVVHDLTIGASV
jgi:hypothetical protein